MRLPRPRRESPRLEPLEPRLVTATTLVVNSYADALSPPSGTVTLRSAIQAANAATGPVAINIATPGTYRLTLPQQSSSPNSGGALTYTGTNNLAIVNTSGGAVVIVGDGTHSVFSIQPTSTTTSYTVGLQGLQVTGGGNGGIAVATGATSLAVSSSIVTGNVSSGSGGGIDMVGGTGSLAIASSQVTNNLATGSNGGGGIAVAVSGQVTIAQSQISDNVAYGGGGGIFVSGAPLTVTGSTLRDNKALELPTPGGGGGGIEHVGPGAVLLAGDIVEGNLSITDGGGYDDAGTGLGNLSVVNSFFLSNSAKNDGGGLATASPKVAIANTTFQGNFAIVPTTIDVTSGGGGIYVGPGSASGSSVPTTSNVTIAGSTIASNRAPYGGGIQFNGSSLALTTSTVESNIALKTGGGLQLPSDNIAASVNNSLFRGNSAASTGGGIFHLGTGSALGLSQDQFTANLASYGGAIFEEAQGTSGHVDQALTIIATSFNANSATTHGGALYLGTDYSNATLVNDTFANNAVGNLNSPGIGGAILFFPAQSADTLSLTNDTINNNTATLNGGGVYQDAGTVMAENTILAQNIAAGSPSDFYYTTGTVTDSGGNLISSTSGAGGHFTGDTFTGSIGLGPLLDNGTAFSNGDFYALAGAPSSQQVVQTEALLPGSPAFARGVILGSPSNDERGFPRPGGGAAKPASGAYEPQYASNATPNQVFVENLYEVLFDRTADAPGLATWAGYLNAGGSPTALAQVLGSSAPALTIDTIRLVRRYLGRGPSAAETGTIVAYLRAGHTPEQAASIFMGSPEFYADYGNSQDAFVMASYQTALGRAPSRAEGTAWDGALASGLSRAAAAAGFLSSQEYLIGVINTDFTAYLGRPATPSDVATYLKAAGFGATPPFFRAILLAASFGSRT